MSHSTRHCLLTIAAGLLLASPLQAYSAPSKVTAGGTNLYGFVSSSDVSTTNPPRGVYEIGQYGELELKYTDPGATYFDRYNCAFLLDGYLYGYATRYFNDDLTVIGTPCYMKVDFNTGKVVERYELPDFEACTSLAYNPNDGYFYFFSSNGPELIRSTVNNPTKFETVKKYNGTGYTLISLAYSTETRMFYGINTSHQFVSMDAEGTQKVISEVPDKNNHMNFMAGMTYSPSENLFYWNFLGADMSSSLYTITHDGNFNKECDLDDNANIDWFVTPDTKYVASAPEQPVIDAIDFLNGSLSGEIRFTMSSKTQDGTALPASVAWSLTLDGTDYKSGTAAPGEKVTVKLTDIPAGNHEFGLTASSGDLVCEPVYRRVFVGFDTPKQPTNVKINETSVLWTAPTGGINAGYIDFTGMTYKVSVTDVFGNVVYSTVTGETSCAYTLENPVTLSLYTAHVIAVSKDKESDMANSSGIKRGEYMTPPVKFAPTQDEFSLMNTADNNNDKICWTWNEERQEFYSRYTANIDMDDYLFLPAMKFDSAEKIYEFSMDASAWSPNFTDEFIEVVLATSPDYDGTIESLVETAKVPCAYDLRGNLISEYKNFQTAFNVIEPGIYYIGIHCSSKADQAGILVKNIKVSDGGVIPTSPAAPKVSRTTPGENGALQATVSITFPTACVNGNPIAEGTELTATVESTVDKVTVKGISGGSAEAVVKTVQGENEIEIYVSNEKGQNSPRTTAKVFTGQTVPSPVRNVKGIISDDMLNFTLFWDAPTEGDTGGYIDPEQLSYNIYYYDPLAYPSNWVLLENVKECEYTFTPNTQDYWYLGIQAVNVAGSSSMMSGSAWAGPAYKLPYADNFKNASEIYETKPWRIFTQDYYAEWTFDYLNNIAPNIFGDDNNTVAMYCGGDSGTEGRVAMPRFSTKDETGAILSMNVYTGSRAAQVTINGYSTFHTDRMYKVGTLPVNAGEEIREVSLELPKELMDQPWVQLIIDTSISKDNNFFAMTAVAVNGTSGVALTPAAEGSISTAPGAIRIAGLDSEAYMIATADGRVVSSGTVRGNDAYLYLAPGIYLVRAGAESAKVIVK